MRHLLSASPLTLLISFSLSRHGTLHPMTYLSAAFSPPFISITRGFSLFHPFKKKGGGGVAALHKDTITASKVRIAVACSLFEMICASLQFARMTLVILLVYRPSSSWVPDVFFAELSTVLEALVTHTCPILIIGSYMIASILTISDLRQF